MEQFIQYLYEYENGERVRNLGFMKVEHQMDKSVVRIYAKQIDEIKGILFEREDGRKYLASWEAESEVLEDLKTTETVNECVKEPIFQEAQIEEQCITEMVEEKILPSQMYCEKIQRQDLVRLPRREWRLANNSFLLHGFYNYHHLLYIEEGEQTFIGVPGIYHEKEKVAANAFGFIEFRRIVDEKLDLSEEEKNVDEDFGYWCRQVERA